MEKREKWNIWVDTGGTFTDCLGFDPDGKWYRAKVLSSSALRGKVEQVLSSKKIIISQDWHAPDHFINGFEFILLGDPNPSSSVKVERFSAESATITLAEPLAFEAWEGVSFEVKSPEEAPILAARLLTQTPDINSLPPLDLRLATTRGTNALLEHKGAPTVLFITKGFGDLLKIGTQQRPDLFALHIEKPAPIYEKAIEVKERVDASGKVLKSLKLEDLKNQVHKLVESGYTSAAVVCINSYVNPEHEQKIGRLLKAGGFTYVSESAELSPFIKILPRAETTVINAYLAPVMEQYLQSVTKHIKKGQLSVMTSAGGLRNVADFLPKDSLLSGPAAGVVGAATVGHQAGFDKIISFDMGGTSTDVSRYDSDYEYVFEHTVGDAHLMAPAVAIETVAAGGGSICSFDGHTLRVGPESAGASPGPACYGAGGPLTVTDINLLAGRLDEANFHIPIEIKAAQQKLDEVTDVISKKEERDVSNETVLEGFLEIASQRMADAIEKISLRKGYDPKEYSLVSFGGAGGQHCCAIARKIGSKTIIIPKDAGLLSAYGLGHAVMEHIEEKQLLKPFDEVEDTVAKMVDELIESGKEILSDQAGTKELVVRRRLLFMRLKGQESTLEISYEQEHDLRESFQSAYERRYGHGIEDPEIEVESMRVVISTRPQKHMESFKNCDTGNERQSLKEKDISFDGENIRTPVCDRTDLATGSIIEGPALILDPYSTVWLEPGWRASVDETGSLILRDHQQEEQIKKEARPEAVELELFTNRFTSIAEKMGEMLQRTSRSVNVKERYDFSCAVLNAEGELVVNAPHIPVHLGALGICVRNLRDYIDMQPGDVIITNHPGYGGSHLPDVTVATPVFTSEKKLIGYVANRAHHAEIGGTRPGSMPPHAASLAEEGVVIPPMYLARKGASRLNEIRDHLTAAEYPTRNVEENIADIEAQMAANNQGAKALARLVQNHGLSKVHHYMKMLKQQAKQMMLETISHIPNGKYEATELLDDGTPLAVKWIITDTAISIDFTGSGPVHPYNLNANPAIVNSVVMYVLRVLIGRPIPLNEGLMDVVELILPESLLNPDFSDDPAQCPAVVGGNIEISQRLTDTLLKPFERIACGQGTMNNVLFGNDRFGYYETVGGGSGAGPDFPGTDAVHQHMTNTRGTDPEVLEQRYPVRLDQYAIRKGSGGHGKFNGGNGIVREMTFLEPVQLSVLTQHRQQAPYGQAGGTPGAKGEQWIIRKGGTKEILEHADARDLGKGDRFILKTPGGGGYGNMSNSKPLNYKP